MSVEPPRASAPRMGRERAPLDRRREAIGAAIEVLAARGAHGLTHREIDRHLEWPIGSTSNYFRRRSDIFIAIAARIVDQDITDLAVLDIDLVRPGGVSEDLLVERIVYLLARTMVPTQRSRTLARAEILFETTRNEDVRLAARAQIAGVNGLFRRIFQQLGSQDPDAAARFFCLLMWSAYVGMSVNDEAPSKHQLRALVSSWVSISIEQGSIDQGSIEQGSPDPGRPEARTTAERPNKP